MSEKVLFERDGAVAIMTINRPESLNSMDTETLTLLSQRAKEAAESPEIRALVITGAGRAFSAGGDVKQMAEGNTTSTRGGEPADRVKQLRDQEEVSRLLYEMPKPTIAAINGHAVGAGLSIALAADIRVASENAKLGTAFARVGFSGDFGGTWLLQRLVGPAKAKEMYFLAEIVDAHRALELGIVSRVVPHDSLMDEAMSLARRLAAGPTLAYGRMKENFTFGATHTFGDTLSKEAENMIASGQTEDHKNAARAFVEKREPEFVGR